MNNTVKFLFENSIPIITLVVTYIISRNSNKTNDRSIQLQKELAEKNLHANIISQSRIDWIQEARKLMADFLLKATSFLFYYGVYFDNEYSLDIEKDTNNKKEIDKKLVEIESLKILLLLYFSDNIGNKEIRNAIYEVTEYINNLIKIYPKSDGSDATKIYKYDDKTINRLLKISTNYFKEQWDRAKRME